ncbi:MAG: 1-acyl-sn-glycerol-3-phosphate acyltransferase [Crocinitomicaceae bacterium]|nr:1-acyl-sn-glycerol-3-phosphate acyltransferase [Crocinitomicaceae bacterium]
MKNGSSSLLYAVLKPWVKLGTDVFYSRLEIRGFDKIPEDCPVILISNHQNALMDPLICCVNFKRELHWLTRADIFKNPRVNRFLYALNMLPIYRERDKVGDLAGKNDETFSACYELLSKKKIVAMFPEGMHRGKKQLHLPLKKGLVRLAFRSLDANPEITNLYIVPVGLDYENFYSYRSKLLINIGHPLDVADFYPMYKEDPVRAMSILMNRSAEALSNCMIDIRDNHHYNDLMLLRPLCDTVAKENDLFSQFQVFRSVTGKISNDPDRYAEMLSEIHQFVKYGKKLKLDGSIGKDDVRIGRLVAQGLKAAAGLLPGMFAFLFFGPVYFVTEKLGLSGIDDSLFKNSIRLVFWVFLVPLWTMVIFFLLITVGISMKWSASVVVAAILSGLVSLAWWNSVKLFRKMIRIYRMNARFSEDFMRWNSLRKSLFKKILQLNKI